MRLTSGTGRHGSNLRGAHVAVESGFSDSEFGACGPFGFMVEDTIGALIITNTIFWGFLFIVIVQSNPKPYSNY